MSDVFHLGSEYPLQTQTFIGGCGPVTPTVATFRHLWYKPPGCRFVGFFLVGAGSGGGGGMTGAAASARGGGGGGGSGAVVRALFLADMVPDILFIATPDGGTGGVAATAGQPGGRAMVGVDNGIILSSLLLVSSNGDSTQGSPGTSGVAGAGGAGALVATIGGAVWSRMAIGWNADAGSGGVAGGAVAGAAGTGFTAGNNIVSGGTGGGGTTSANFVGGAITGAGIVPTINGGTSGGGQGQHGLWIPQPWTSTGATGGGSDTAFTGGRGGQGGPGSGGGGGGAGVTGGAGGDGGPAVCIVVAF